MPLKCRNCGKTVMITEAALRRHDNMCMTYRQMSDKQRMDLQRRQQEAHAGVAKTIEMEQQKMTEFTHLGKEVRKNRDAFAIDGRRIKILCLDQKYFESNGDEQARYLSFRFVCGPGTTTEGSKYVITHKAFLRKATLWEEPLQERFVTIGQLMERNGAPCEEGCRALLAYIMNNHDVGVGKNRDQLIISITKMWNHKWNCAISTQSLYDWWKKEYPRPMPYDYLVWICESMGGAVIGAGSHEPSSKSYQLLCRQLGIRT